MQTNIVYKNLRDGSLKLFRKFKVHAHILRYQFTVELNVYVNQNLLGKK